MGQAPATGRNSLRTTPRNFPGRSGTREDQVFLCSPETAAASALCGVITDPRSLDMEYPNVELPCTSILNRELLRRPPVATSAAATAALVKGPNIVALPELHPLPDDLVLRVLLRVGDDISTDEILPAGTRVLPLRSNIPKISEFAFESIDTTYPIRARKNPNGHAVVAGRNYGQGSSREHAALATRYLGLRLVLAQSFARIHYENLVNFGVLPLVYEAPALEGIAMEDVLVVRGVRQAIERGGTLEIQNATKCRTFAAKSGLSDRQVEILLAGGIINWVAQRQDTRRSA
jgi:aconitate hydratase